MKYTSENSAPLFVRRFLLFAVALAVGAPTVARAQRSAPFKNSPLVKAAFYEITAKVRDCVVRVECGGRQVALGTVIDAAGGILTKASQLEGEIVCRLSNDSKLPAKLESTREDYDLALLRVDARELTPISFDLGTRDLPGRLLMTPDQSREPLALGVLSVPRRVIPRRPGILGVSINQTETGPQVVQIAPGSAASKANLRIDDIIQQVNDKQVKTSGDLVAAIRNHVPGSRVTLKILRGEDQKTVTAVLGGEEAKLPMRLGGALSRRVDGFPVALQHDTVLNPNQCGGPLVGLDGNAVGVNIARAGRVTSYAIPGDVVAKLIKEMKPVVSPKQTTATSMR